MTYDPETEMDIEKLPLVIGVFSAIILTLVFLYFLFSGYYWAIALFGIVCVSFLVMVVTVAVLCMTNFWDCGE